MDILTPIMTSTLRFVFAFWLAGFALFAWSAHGDVVAITDPATDLRFGTAVLNGTVTNGDALAAFTSYEVRFEVGTAANAYDFHTTGLVHFDVPLHSPGGPVHFGFLLGPAYSFNKYPLTPNTTYHYRFSVVNLQPGGLSVVGDDQVFTTLAAPTLATLAATNVGASSATLHGEVSGPQITAPGQFEYSFVCKSASNNSFGVTIGGVADPAGFTPGGTLPISVVAGPTFFPQFTTIRYALRVADPETGVHVDGDPQEFTTDGNTPPLAPDGYGVIESSESSVAIHTPISDPDVYEFGAVSITAVSDPAHGTVQIDPGGQFVVYTKGLDFTDSDTFTYTVKDLYGASTTGNVFIGTPDTFYLAAAGTYATNLFRDSDGLPAGSLRVTVDSTGAFTGSLDFFDASFPFTGAFQHVPNTGDTGIFVQFNVARTGLPPFEFHLGVDYRNGFPTLVCLIINQNVEYDTVPQPALLPRGRPVFEAGRYAAVLPAVNNAALPQGNGFATIVVKPNGSIRFVGKTGDGTAFAQGSRMRRDRSVLINTKLGRGKQDRMTGGVTFATKADTDFTGQFNWYRPQRATGAYSGGFNYGLNALGARFEAPRKGEEILPFSDPAHPALQFALLNHAGASLVSGSVAVTRNGSTVTTLPGGERLKISVNRHTGVFTGSLSTAANRKHPRKFSGVIVQKQKRGAGVGGQSGEDGRVEFVAQ